MENGIPYSPPQAEARTKPHRQDRGADALDGKGGLQNKARHPDDAAHLGGGDGFLHDPSLFQPDPASGKNKSSHGHGDNAHTAHLDQAQKDQLAKAGPVAGRVMDHKAGDAGGGGGGKQGVKKGCSPPLPCGKWQHQQRRPQQDQAQETKNNDAGGGHPVNFPKRPPRRPALFVEHAVTASSKR